MKIKTSELIGAALDWAVCKANGEHQFPYDEYTPVWMSQRRYSTDWSQGGPIIERERIGLDHYPDGSYPGGGEWGALADAGQHESFGPTPLIAALRCFVASKLGYEVEVPDELLEN